MARSRFGLQRPRLSFSGFEDSLFSSRVTNVVEIKREKKEENYRMYERKYPCKNRIRKTNQRFL